MRASSNSVLFSLLLVMGFASSASAEEYVKSYPVSGRLSPRADLRPWAVSTAVHTEAATSTTLHPERGMT